MIKISIDNNEYQVPSGITIIQACELAGIEIPRFCYHEKLAIAGNCRMCLVEVIGGPPKPVASCAMSVADGMQIFTTTPMVKKAREGVMEFLLANHPLDCPICDQGGECDLQDQAFQYGSGKSNFNESKRAVENKDLGPLVKTQMTRCIHCTRCVRFMEDIAGTGEMGAVSRGEGTEITTYLEKSINSELSGNIIDLCPVGALTSKPYSFKARSWELKKTQSVDIMDAMGSNIRVDSRGLEVMRILPCSNEEINEEWLSDKSRFCYDGLKYQRLDKAYIRKNGKLVEATITEAIDNIIDNIKILKGNEIAGFSGKLSAVEDIFALKNFLDKIGCNNYESRLANQAINSSDRGSYLFNTTISALEKADACLLIGVNPRLDAPLLNSRLRKTFIKNPQNIAVIGLNDDTKNEETQKIDLTYQYQDLGNNISTLKAIINEEHNFANILKNAKNPILIIGEDAVSEESENIIELAKLLANKFNFIKEGWNGFNFLAKNTGLINALELGFINKGGIKQIINNQEIKTIFLLGVDDDIDFNALKDKFIIYLGSHGDNGANVANVILPCPAYTEKEATFINFEGRAQSTSLSIFPIGDAKAEWQFIVEMAEKMGVNLDFKNLEDLKTLLSNHKTIANLNNSTAEPSISLSGIEVKINNPQMKIIAQKYNFYLTNAIARASRILNRCSVFSGNK
ncbi:MAG: NADH-quinone oxidoreductase subunit NuoG [Rickettsiales bacterium]|nr:NADH-quinone oxidoreductase subunit NuoG [Rickettsiales bacterium]